MATFIDTIELEDAIPLVAPFVPGAPDPTIIQYLREHAIALCERTLVWQGPLEAVLTVADQEAYAFPLPDSAALHRVLSWDIDGRGEWVTPAYARKVIGDASDADLAWTEDKVQFRVNPTPAEAGKTMTIIAALKPTRDADEIPEFIYEQHIRAIADGAIGVLSAMKQPWQDMAQAAFYMDRFESAVARAASAIARGNGRTRDRRVVCQFY